MGSTTDRDDVKKQGIQKCQAGANSENIEVQHMMHRLQETDKRSKRIVQ